MQDRRVARRYANALYASAKGHGNVAKVEADLDLIAGLLASNSKFGDFLTAPYASTADKAALLRKVFADRIQPLTLSLLERMLDKGREAEIEPVRQEFVEIRRIGDGIVHARITSAGEITEAQRKAIADKVASALGRQVETQFDVDPKLIGGVKVAYENNVLDGTVKGSLARLREQLRYQLLKQN